MNLGDQITKKFTTGRLYWLPQGQTDGYVDFGNVADYRHDPKIERVQHFQKGKGRGHADLSLIKSSTLKKTLTLDEHYAQTILLLLLGTQGNNAVQQAIAGADSTTVTSDDVTVTADDGNGIRTATINPVTVGRTYDLGLQCVTIATVKDNNNVALTAGVHYILDYGSGMFTVLNGVNLGANPSPWTITFSVVDVTDLLFTALNSLLTQGTFRFHEFDQFDSVPLAVETFTGQVYVTGWGDNNTDKFNEFTLEVLILA